MMLGSLFLLFLLVLVGLVAVFPIVNKLGIPLWTKLKYRTPALPCSAGGESSSSSDTFNSTPPWKHDVFLSFAGKDTRLTFLSHLDEAFKTSGIKPFKDDVDLERGGVIKEDLIQGIQDSLCAVLVISENYADSTWCLDELQKILESRKSLGRRVFPIFYDVDPSDVRNQRKTFGKAFAKHKKNFRQNPAIVQNWRNALSEIGNISGHDTRGKHEAELIKKIVGDVWSYLSSKLPSDYDNLVGIDSRVADLMPFLKLGLDDNLSLGIWGMGGLGKTTLARVVSKKLSHNFEVCCFFEKVGETLLQQHGLVSLQKSLLSHLKIQNMEIHDGDDGKDMLKKYLREKKVLLVLDDVHDMSQLRNLAGSPDWFGKGSRIIITTRDSHLLIAYGIDKQRIYEMEPMKKDESLQLFSKKAFRKDYPEDNYLELSKSVVEYAGGLPLALEALGSFLCGRSEAKWRDALDRLKQIPDDDLILQTLQISYDGLKNEKEKTTFLDIACLFKGWPRKEVIQILENCDLNPTIGIEVLIERSLLVETEYCTLEMHDLLVDLGRSIDRRESPNVGKHSRLWKFEDIKEVLENNMGYEEIQAIVMEDGHRRDQKEIKLHPEAFSKMSNIRLLMLNKNYYHPFKVNFVPGSPLILPWGLKLPHALKVVRWASFPLEALPLETPLLGYIKMHYSRIEKLWSGIHVMNKLTLIDLTHSRNFTETPDFSGVPYLQHLLLCEYESLVTIHPSLGKLKELVEVDLFRCRNLRFLPEKLETNSLMKLDLGFCVKVEVLPEFGEDMKKLSYIGVACTAIARLPESIVFLAGLRDLDLEGCKILNLKRLLKIHITRQISGLSVIWLTELCLIKCGLNDGSIADGFGSVSSLIVLDLSWKDFVDLPIDCFSSLYRLLFLSLDRCKRLKSLPRLPPGLIRLEAVGCDSMEPLSDRQLCNLVSSLDHEYRGRTKYVISDKEDDDVPLMFKQVEIECLPLRDFCAIIPGSYIPSWFTNKEDYTPAIRRFECEIKVNIPGYLRDSEWSGIVVCLLISGSFIGASFNWSSKAAEDDDYIWKDWAHDMAVYAGNRHLCIMVLELNEETCWKHLTAHNNTLHIQLSNYNCRCNILGCGWRVLCNEWCTPNRFNQLASPNEVNLPRRVLYRFFGKLCYSHFV